jgi:hypothetical protein
MSEPSRRIHIVETKAATLRNDIERYRRLLRIIADPSAIETIEIMIAEKESRLLAFGGG